MRISAFVVGLGLSVGLVQPLSAIDFSGNTQTQQNIGVQNNVGDATQFADQNAAPQATANGPSDPKPGEIDTSFAGGIVSLSSSLYQYNLILGIDHYFADYVLVAGFPSTMNKNVQNSASQAVTACVDNTGKGCVVEIGDTYLAKGQIPNTKTIIYDTIGTSGPVLLGQILDLTPGVMRNHFAYVRLAYYTPKNYVVKNAKMIDAGKDAQLNAGIFGDDGIIYAIGKVKGSKDWDAAFLAVDGKDTPLCGNGFMGKDFGGKESLDAILMDDQGKIIAAGTRDKKLLLVKIDPNKCEFENYAPGAAAADTSAMPADPTAIIFDANGSIFAGGTISKPYGESDIFVRKYLSNGYLDSTFGSGGEVILDLGKIDSLTGLALDESGQILVSGAMSTDSENTDFLVARLEPNGKLDKGFGPNQNGIVVIKFPSAIKSVATGIHLDGQKRILVTGVQYYSGKMGISVVRLLGGKLKEAVVAAPKQTPEGTIAKAEERVVAVEESIKDEKRVTKLKKVKVAKNNEVTEVKEVVSLAPEKRATETSNEVKVADKADVSRAPEDAKINANDATQVAIILTPNAETNTAAYLPKDSDVVTDIASAAGKSAADTAASESTQESPPVSSAPAVAPQIDVTIANPSDVVTDITSAPGKSAADTAAASESTQESPPVSSAPAVAPQDDTNTANSSSDSANDKIKEAIAPAVAPATAGVVATESLKDYELAVLIAPEPTPKDTFEMTALIEKKNVVAPQAENANAAPAKSGGCSLIR